MEQYQDKGFPFISWRQLFHRWYCHDLRCC